MHSSRGMHGRSDQVPPDDGVHAKPVRQFHAFRNRKAQRDHAPCRISEEIRTSRLQALLRKTLDSELRTQGRPPGHSWDSNLGHEGLDGGLRRHTLAAVEFRGATAIRGR